ncbi:hypothetical protein RFI_10629 [Reticulomyxa filosa]|uniref:Uncharacterized protein n=1 Tax=Reticulomyxa filosa TaxID=46433 RepID=X6NLC3_RETFI|nr:hypothetical protein RFI_10629 [Reticulomyxa filosa]|eukprot:ETO26509.1 hypothetical protein RFI_10629 [Reticulomyxa filosa]
MEQLQDIFNTIEKEILSRTWNLCEGNFDEVIMILSFIIENNTNFQQQLYLINLLAQFNNKIDKTTILKTWKQCNQIYVDTNSKLMEISFYNYKTEENELKIMREICLYILWNILSYPTNIKYRQINTNSLYQLLKHKCEKSNVNLDQLFINMEYFLKVCKFQKRNDCNWYCNDDIQLSVLLGCYFTWINQQPIYKTRRHIPETIYMLSNGKWKEYLILFDYEYRRIILLNKKSIKFKKIKIKTLQVGNPKKLSLELNVHIQWYNDYSEIETNCIKYSNLILNHSWHFRTINFIEREFLSNCCSVNALYIYIFH